MTLEHIPEKSYVIIDATESLFIDPDILELIKEFKDAKAVRRNIRLELVGFKAEYKIDNTLNTQFVYSEHDETEAPVIVGGTPRRKHRELLGKLIGKTKPAEA